MKSVLKNLAGETFGRLTVISRAENIIVKTTGKNVVAWNCVCECGNVIVVRGIGLKTGNTTSCGCYQKEWTIKKHTKHGRAQRNAQSAAYKTWCRIKARCENENSLDYPSYGGAGIGVCERWGMFENFIEDMGEPPTAKHSIDRIENSKGYSPDNCRWATPIQQARNKTNNRLITANGTTKSLMEWSEITGIHCQTILYRIKAGWDASEAINSPPDPHRAKGHIKKTRSPQRLLQE